MNKKDIQSQRKSLPVYKFKDDLLKAIKEHPSLVIVGETGSGKTTQIPQYLFELKGTDINKESIEASLEQDNNGITSNEDIDLNFAFNNICVTQPRRIAAITVARRVSQETGFSLGKEIGYTIRFDDKCSSNTRLRYVTDGILLREAISDSLLSKYDCIMIDEAHERTLDTDIVIGLVKKAQHSRKISSLKDKNIKPLKVVVMSATLNVEKFSDFFDNCPIFSIPGRTFDITVNHHSDLSIEKLKSSYVERAVETALQIHFESPPGDMLIFLTGQQEINRAMSQFLAAYEDISRDRNDIIIKPYVVPIYAALEQIDQRAAFEPSPPQTRKIVFATNIAQTSITIPGIIYVIDSGFVKQKTFEPKTGMDALLVVPISRAAAIQRAGRAGRTKKGEVYRLYSREAFENLSSETIPEIQRSSLLSTILSMKAMGIDDIPNFDFLDPPGINHINSSLRKLSMLGALDLEGKITELGLKMAQLPLSPYLSCALISSCMNNSPCSYEILVISAMLSTEDVIIKPRTEAGQVAQKKIISELFLDPTGDHLTLYNIYRLAEKNNFDREWCYDHYLNQRLLKHSASILEQIGQLLNKLGLSTRSLLKTSIKSKVKPTLGMDTKLILKDLCRGYFLNIAKKHPNGKVFYHYGATTKSDDSDMEPPSSPRMLALSLHPSSVLFNSEPSTRPYSHLDSGIDWVMYSQILYTTQCLLRQVSSIDPGWFLHYLEDARKNYLPKSQPNSKPQTPDNSLLAVPEALSSRGSSSPASDRSPARAAQVEEALSRYLARKKLKKK